jgi:hypothetical protein
VNQAVVNRSHFGLEAWLLECRCPQGFRAVDRVALATSSGEDVCRRTVGLPLDPKGIERHRRLNAVLDRAQILERLRVQIVGSAGDVKDRADLPWLEARDQSAGLFRRDSDKVNVLARSLLHHLMHDRQ